MLPAIYVCGPGEGAPLEETSASLGTKSLPGARWMTLHRTQLFLAKRKEKSNILPQLFQSGGTTEL